MTYEIVCVRHGATAGNAAGIFQGQRSDTELSGAGVAQAAALARALAAERFDRAVSSDLRRARATAEAILADRDVPLQIDPDWREFDFGAWDGLTWPEIAARFPEEAERFQADATSVAPPGGEAFAAVIERVRRGLTALVAALPQGGRALVVTHAGPLHALRKVVLRTAPHERLTVRFSLAGITRYRLVGERAEVVAFDDVTHLTNLSTE